MKTALFDGVLDTPLRDPGEGFDADISLGEAGVRGSVLAYADPATGEAGFVRVATGRDFDVKWRDRFEFRSADGRYAGAGRVLLPGSPDPKKMKPAKREALLGRLSKGEREMILVLAEEAGVRGLRQGEIADFCRLEPAGIENLARSLEEKDAVRILSFSPLFLVSRDALEFLRERVVEFLARFHEGHPNERGVEVGKIGERFGPPDKILSLVLRALEKSGRVRSAGGLVWLADFRIPLRPEDEEVLERLETMVYKGEFASASLEDLRRELGLSESRLQALLTVLTERKKIVKGRDGFLLHSRWLEDLVKTIKESGGKELSVADFKALTGLSRKYAIPLLELLDEMGVTRRRGSVREIL
jgi:selenocysteine-specific elongation factor